MEPRCSFARLPPPILGNPIPDRAPPPVPAYGPVPGPVLVDTGGRSRAAPGSDLVLPLPPSPFAVTVSDSLRHSNPPAGAPSGSPYRRWCGPAVSQKAPLCNIPGTAAEIQTTSPCFPEGVCLGFVHFQSALTGPASSKPISAGQSSRIRVPEAGRGCPAPGLTGSTCALNFWTTTQPNDDRSTHPGVLHGCRFHPRGWTGGRGWVLVKASKRDLPIRVCPVSPGRNSGGLPAAVPHSTDSPGPCRPNGLPSPAPSAAAIRGRVRRG